ncbi:hypothetical protein GCM10011352_23500 [Marinobacterium zhoushanense]|uniref:Lipoprotein n=1 Tax=Marinobacterium zhoushanense TaxID=1679163 RepID=A0ABQ1KJQ2_9GAMM|nr:hypothetical protein [Marinobacterium zhoushanense]GGB96672.1 hypothetical protein GCM10011352_23500 [Marinobacterium zhoushanense]
MKTGLTSRNLLRGFTLLLALSLSACVYGPYDSHARVGVHGYYDSAYDDFYFYPDVSVYFGINSGRYYYRPHGHWISTYTLPRTIVLKPERRVIIKKLPRRSPYDRYRDHRNRYDRHDRDRYRDHDRNRRYYYDGSHDQDGAYRQFFSDRRDRDGPRYRHGDRERSRSLNIQRFTDSVESGRHRDRDRDRPVSTIRHESRSNDDINSRVRVRVRDRTHGFSHNDERRRRNKGTHTWDGDRERSKSLHLNKRLERDDSQDRPRNRIRLDGWR